MVARFWFESGQERGCPMGFRSKWLRASEVFYALLGVDVFHRGDHRRGARFHDDRGRRRRYRENSVLHFPRVDAGRAGRGRVARATACLKRTEELPPTVGMQTGPKWAPLAFG